MSNLRERYACISLLNKNVSNSISKLQQEIYELTGSKKFMEEWPPHITIGNGNELNSVDITEIESEFSNIAKKHSPFEIKFDPVKHKIKDFSKIDQRYSNNLVVLPTIINDKLSALVNDIELVLKRYPVFYNVFPYDPHVTIAARDIKDEDVNKILEYLKTQDIPTSAKIESFSLFLSPVGISNAHASKEVRTFKLFK